MRSEIGHWINRLALHFQRSRKAIGKVLDIIARLIVIYFVYMMFRNGNALVAKQLKTAQTTPVMKIPMYTLYLSLSISFCLTLITQVLMLIGKIFNIPMEPITRVDDLIDTLFGRKKKEADNA